MCQHRRPGIVVPEDIVQVTFLCFPIKSNTRKLLQHRRAHKKEVEHRVGRSQAYASAISRGMSLVSHHFVQRCTKHPWMYPSRSHGFPATDRIQERATNKGGRRLLPRSPCLPTVGKNVGENWRVYWFGAFHFTPEQTEWKLFFNKAWQCREVCLNICSDNIFLLWSYESGNRDRLITAMSPVAVWRETPCMQR